MTEFCSVCLEKKRRQDSDKQTIKDFVDKEFGVDTSEKTRRKYVVIPRMIAMYLMRKTYKSTPLQSIADFYGIKTHATVINAVTAIENYRDTDKVFAKKLGSIEARYAVNNIRANEFEDVMNAERIVEGDFYLDVRDIRDAKISIKGSVKTSKDGFKTFLIMGEISVGPSEIIRFRAYKTNQGYRIRRVYDN